MYARVFELRQEYPSLTSLVSIFARFLRFGCTVPPIAFSLGTPLAAPTLSVLTSSIRPSPARCTFSTLRVDRYTRMHPIFGHPIVTPLHTQRPRAFTSLVNALIAWVILCHALLIFINRNHLCLWLLNCGTNPDSRQLG